MKKAVFVFSLILISVFSFFQPFDTKAATYSGKCGETLYWRLENDTLTISGTGYMDAYTAGINEPWSDHKSLIVNVVVEDGVNSIGYGAFQYYSELKTLTIGEDVTYIGNYAFDSCRNLSEINWNAKNVKHFENKNGIFSYAGTNGDGINIVFGNSVENVPSYLFYPYTSSSYYPKVSSVTLGNSVETIGHYAFYSCSGLTSIELPDSVTSIGSYAFYNCSNLKNISLSQNLTVINSFAFSYCKQLESIQFYDKLTTIGESSFTECFGLTELIIPNSVTTIGISAFSRCDNIKKVTLSEQLKTINASAFSGCRSLEKIIIPNSVTSIGNYAFSYCAALEKVTIGTNVTSIGANCFSDCQSMNELNWNALNVADFVAENNVFYSAGREGNGIIVNFDDNVKVIPAFAFYPKDDYIGSPNIVSVNIGNGVKTIGKCAFRNCYNMKNLSIGESVATFGNQAFFKCKGLTEIYWNAYDPYDLTDSSQVFNLAGADSGGIDLVIGDTTREIPNYAFGYGGGSYIKTITIGKNVTRIGDYAFAYSTELKNVIIPDNVTAIGNSAFYSCQKIMNAILGNGLKSIGIGAFRSCSALKSITIPENVTVIGYEAFAYTGLREIYWNAKNVSDYTSSSGQLFNRAGDGIYSIKLIIGAAVERIPDYAFYHSNSSTAPRIYMVVFNKNLKSIGYSAFDKCQYITDVYYGGSAIEWLSVSIGNNNTYLKNATLHLNYSIPVELYNCNAVRDGEKCTYSFNMRSDNPIKGKFVIAFYKYNKLIACFTEEITNETTEYSAMKTVDVSGNDLTYKIFFWKDFETYSPYCGISKGMVTVL